MTLANRLTCGRVALTALFMALLFQKGAVWKGLAVVFFLLAMLTDYWDGRLARERNEITRFGTLMDPIADKLLTLSAFLAFVQKGLVPAWMVVAILARDFFVTGFRLFVVRDDRSQGARPSGKHKTALQFAAILGILLFLTFQETRFWNPAWNASARTAIDAGMLVIVTVTLWSGIRYVLRNRDLLAG